MGSKPKSSARGRILAVDIGGTGLKAALVDRRGKLLTERLRVKTPHPSPPRAVLAKLDELIRPLAIDSSVIGVSVGFPGVVRDGWVRTAPNLGTKAWEGFDLAGALRRRWKKPVRVLNDADMQGLGAIGGRRIELVITLGTGMGTAIFENGRLGPHLEISHHPFRKGETYEDQLGNAAYEKIGKKKWNRRVELAIETLRVLTNFDRLYIGGGNAKHLTLALDGDIRIVSNDCGVRGGAALWRDCAAKNPSRL